MILCCKDTAIELLIQWISAQAECHLVPLFWRGRHLYGRYLQNSAINTKTTSRYKQHYNYEDKYSFNLEVNCSFENFSFLSPKQTSFSKYFLSSGFFHRLSFIVWQPDIIKHAYSWSQDRQNEIITLDSYSHRHSQKSRLEVYWYGFFRADTDHTDIHEKCCFKITNNRRWNKSECNLLIYYA